MKIQMSLADFFGPTFVANLGLLLGIDSSRIKVAKVGVASTRRLDQNLYYDHDIKDSGGPVFIVRDSTGQLITSSLIPPYSPSYKTGIISSITTSPEVLNVGLQADDLPALAVDFEVGPSPAAAQNSSSANAQVNEY